MFFCFFPFGTQVQAQEHWTEGPVWVINYYRTKPGKFDDYIKFLRRNFAKISVEQKKAGLILDAKILLQPTVNSANDWDVAVAYLYQALVKRWILGKLTLIRPRKSPRSTTRKQIERKEQQQMTLRVFQSATT